MNSQSKTPSPNTRCPILPIGVDNATRHIPEPCGCPQTHAPLPKTIDFAAQSIFTDIIGRQQTLKIGPYIVMR